MALLLAGIDEAGYGPMLGPLCVGCAAFRIEGWSRGDPAPDLWALLRDAVCREPETRGRRRPRIPIADSKRLKLANSVTSRHPLVHIEGGVLAFLRCVNGDDAEEVGDDAALFRRLGAGLDDRPWYGSASAALPLGRTAGEVAVSAAALGASMDRAGVVPRTLRCEVVPEGLFNSIVRRTRSKSDATLHAIGAHLRLILDASADDACEVRVVCDRLGGRTMYRGVLEALVPGAIATVLDESPGRSRYALDVDQGGRCRSVIVQFEPEAEVRHLPVALASMTAKYVRELAMARFNRYWCTRMPELKPTAGYVQDARRWLRDSGVVVTPEDRRAMVRLA